MDDQFSIDISNWVAKAEGRMDLVVRKISLELARRIILRSPVDTGRFRANWQVGVNSLPAGYDWNKFDRSGRGAIAAVRAMLGEAKAGVVIYVVNNLPYAWALEYGHSKQAPQGMVRITVQEFNQVVGQAADEAKRDMP